MIAVATTDSTTITAYRWEAGALVAAPAGQRSGSAHRHAPTTTQTGPRSTSVSPSNLPTLAFLADI